MTKPRSTAQMIPGSQTPQLGQPTRMAGRRKIGNRTIDNRTMASGVVAGVVVGHVVGEDQEGGVAAAGDAVAIFRVVAASPMPTVHVGRPAIRTANRVGSIEKGEASVKGQQF